MIAHKHDTNVIKSVLADAVRQGVPDPDGICVDGSHSLLGAASLTYNKCSYRDLLENAYQYILEENIAIQEKEKVESEEVSDSER